MEIVSENYTAFDNKHPLVIAYFTAQTPYQHEAEMLRLSLESMEWGWWICGVKNLGSWQKNTQMKSQFIKHALETFPGEPLLYLDVDSVMMRSPELLDDIKADMGAVHFVHKNELLSGTLFLGNTPKCHEAVDQWICLNEMYPETLPNGQPAWDQRTLQMAIDKTEGINFQELPQGYTYISELSKRHCPDIHPVILHTRAAFRFKRGRNFN